MPETAARRACGWLKDKYGLSWQVVPAGMGELFADSDPKRAERAELVGEVAMTVHQCPDCELRFLSENELREHFDSEHPGQVGEHYPHPARHTPDWPRR